MKLNEYQSLLGTLLIIFFVAIIRSAKKMKRESQETGRKWLFKEVLPSYGQFGGLLFLPFQLLAQFNSVISNNYLLFIASFLLVALAITHYIILVIIPKKAEQYLIETYREYEFSH